MDWQYNGKDISADDIPLKAIGFIYKITCISDNKWYIGRKLLTKAATKTVNGKKKKIRKPSDWEEYYSSSPALLQEIETKGKNLYKREILLFVDTKASLTYAEEYCLFTSGALFDPMCYNGNIRSRIQRSWFAKTPKLQSELKALIL
jgi:hypothetical protein